MNRRNMIGRGKSGLVYREENGTCLKVYYIYGTTPEEMGEVRRLYSQAIDLRKNNIQIPHPLEVAEVSLSRGDVPYPLIDSIREKINGETLTGKHPAIRMEYIEGRKLSRRFFPSKRISDKLWRIHRDIMKKGGIFMILSCETMLKRQRGTFISLILTLL